MTRDCPRVVLKERVPQHFTTAVVNLRVIRRGMRAAQLLCFVALTGSCSLWPDGEFPPGGADRIAERPEYLMWWKLVEECSGRRRRMDVEWYSTNGRLIEHGDVWASGLFRPYPDRIALVDPSKGPVARHEMLHAILERDGHPLDAFAGACAGVVDFVVPPYYGVPAKEIGVAPVMRTDSALSIVVTTSPAVPSLSTYGGHYVFVAELTNRTGKYVRVTPGTDPSLFVQYADSVGVRRVNYRLTNDDYVYFAPGQTRRVILDATVYKTGSYDAIAGYGRARSPSVKLVLQK